MSILSDDRKVASPGMKYKHYAPKARVILVRGTLEQFQEFLRHQREEYGVLCFEEDVPALNARCVTYGKEQDPASQAHALFDALRRLDKEGFSLVYARITGEEGVGQAVYNRLLRAAAFDEIQL